ESSLNPVARSNAGAAGIWQIIPGTASLCGLRMNKYVDERKDIVRSTEAAISYLEKLYKIYGDWALAIAAYNCGPGNVDRAIARAKTTDYWKLESYLPNETRNYVPRFIAANYIMNYYTEYDITPTILNMDLQLTESVRIYKSISFKEIVRITGIPDSVLEALNPGFKSKFIPASAEGYSILMPKRVIPIIEMFNASPDQSTINAYFGNNDYTNPAGYNWPDQYVVTQYQVQKDDNLQSLAEVFACDPYHLIVWNNLNDDKVMPGQTLLVYIPKKVYIEKFINSSFSPLPITVIDEVFVEDTDAPVEVASISAEYNAYAPSDRKYQYHFIRQRESLQDIASQYNATTISDLLILNEIDDPSAIRPGMILKIREL
ncbi:MAG: transglycosylase SLT domain-containing protein, partial [Saprospiraceae bacterium]